MTGTEVPRWLEWARTIEALGQTGRHYALNEFDRERYQRLVEIAAEMISTYSNLNQGEIVELFNYQTGYATPRVDVRGAVFRQGKLLMVRERMDDRWTMPGGWADVGDVPSEAAEREVWEEAGFWVKARKVIGVYDANRSGPLELFHAFKVVFLCDLLGGEARDSFETSEVSFFSKEEVPVELSGERTRSRHIEDAFHAYEHPESPTVFD
jgi:ADP-ribose pyrophosphatase YjhB (NUDIX family)